jgi:hypothetical protein
MASSYASFVVRCWTVGDGERRIKIEHIQSGEETQVATWAAALAWLGARSETSPGGSPSGSERPPARPDGPVLLGDDPPPERER